MSWIETTATVVQAIAVSGAAWAAWRGLTTWRREMTARRRAELAEHTLATFYEARDIISAARFPGSSGEEGSSRQRRANKTENEARYKNALYVPVERLTRQAEFWGKFEAAHYSFMVLFGEEAARPFETVRQIKNRVMISAGMLVRTYGQVNEEREDRQSQRERWEAYIGWGVTEEDEVAREVDGAVSAIERVCKPAIT